MLKIDIYSDPVCPWCYVGKSRLDSALRHSAGMECEISWRPFQLNPDMPAAGMDRADYLKNKFGGTQGALAAYSPLLQAAKDDGLEMNLHLIRTMPSSLNAHRIIHWADIDGHDSSAVAEALFRAFFVEGSDIGNTGVLAGLAESCGMNRELTERLLNSRADIEFVNEADRMARRAGIHAVPCFVINNAVAVSGAQPVSVWQKVFEDFQQTAEAGQD